MIDAREKVDALALPMESCPQDGTEGWWFSEYGKYRVAVREIEVPGS